MSETFFRTETARADRKTLCFFFQGGGINFFFLLYGVGKNFRGGYVRRGGGKKLIRLVYILLLQIHKNILNILSKRLIQVFVWQAKAVYTQQATKAKI